MRLAVAIAVVAVMWAGAVYVHQRHIWTKAVPATIVRSGIPAEPKHPSWEDPVAVLLVLGGLAVAVGIAANGRNFAKPS